MRIRNVPGSRALHGIIVDQNNIAWVAGTDANVVTLVHLGMGKVLTSFSVPQPIAVTSGLSVVSASEKSVTLFNPDSLQILSKFGLSATPQDYVGSFCTCGDSVVQTVLDGYQVVATYSVPATRGAYGLTAAEELGASRSVFLMATVKDSDAVLLIRPVGAPFTLEVVNAASFASAAAGIVPPRTGVAPGSLASTFADTRTSQAQSGASLPLPTSLGGVSLRVGGSLSFVNSDWVYSSSGSVLAPLLFVGPEQINFQVPPGVLGEAVPVQLQRADGSTRLSSMRVVSTAPGIFTVLSTGKGPGAVLNQDNSLNLPTNPASRGSVIQIFATGAGATNPSVAAGVAAPSNPLALTVAQPTVTIGGKTAVVQFSGLAPGFVGLWQINAVVPLDATVGQAVGLGIAIGTIALSTVSIAVQ